MNRIVAIGGGGMVEGENLPIDERIVELTGKDRPRTLFVGTASGDDPEKAAEFHSHYGERLGCHTDTLTPSARSAICRRHRTQVRLGRPDLRGWWQLPAHVETVATPGHRSTLPDGAQTR